MPARTRFDGEGTSAAEREYGTDGGPGGAGHAIPGWHRNRVVCSPLMLTSRGRVRRCPAPTEQSV